MKKILISFLAVALLAACTKSEVTYDAPQEITFAPVAKNITKAAVTGNYPTDQRLAVYANYGVDEPGSPYSASFNVGFLSDAIFSYKTVGSVTAWGGGYSWPTNGSLVFAGYSLPAIGEVGTSRTYDFASDALTIEGYTQSTNTAETFDLGWFGRTAESYNYRNQEDAVDVTLSHALTWVEIQAKGEGSTIADGNPWTITKITMNNVANTGTVECIGSGAGKATWTELGEATGSIEIFNGSKPLAADVAVFENNTAGTLVIPQMPTAVDAADPVATLTVTYTYKSPKGEEMPAQTSTVSLAVTDGWKSGYKYTYTLNFKATEILVAPSYGEWADRGNQTVTVE